MRIGPGTAKLAVAGISAATLPLLLGTTFAGFSWLVVPAAAASFGATHIARGIPSGSRTVLWLAVGSGAFAVVSIVTGLLNGLSDEPYSTPSYATLGLQMYTHPVSFHYLQYGRTYLETSYDVYLPFLTYVQVPGLDYRWVALAAWGGTLYRVRGDRYAAVVWASPWVATLAANGQNDFVALLFVTLSLVQRPRRLGVLVEVISLGLKQFANVIVFFYHVARHEYWRAGAAIAATFALLLPFLWLDAGAVYCHVILGDPTVGCQLHGVGFFLFKRNYWLYPVWMVAVFHTPLGRSARDLARRVRAWGSEAVP